MTTPSSPTHRPAAPDSQPRPTSGKENSKAMWYVVGMVAIALVAVVGFNVMGPKGNASLTGDTPPAASSSSSSSSSDNGMAPATPTASSPAQAGNQGPAQARPMSPDTPVDASRNTMGAPAGATLPSTDKPVSAQTSTGGAVPMQATAPASDVPASPASR